MKASLKHSSTKAYNFLPAAGMRTTVEPWLLPTNKLAYASNVLLVAAEDERDELSVKARTRPGTRRLSTAALPEGEQVLAHLRLAGVDYLASDAHIYHLDSSGQPQLIGEVAAKPSLLEYLGYCLVMDGGYLETVDPQSAHAHNVVWDTAGFMADLLGEDPTTSDGSISLYSGSITRAGFKTTLEDWGPGTVPLSSVKAYLSKTGSPTGNAVAKIFSEDGSSLLATSENLDVSELATTMSQQSLEADTPHQAQAGSTVIVVVEYSGGDASNKVNLHYKSAASGGQAITCTGSTWSAVDASKNPMMTLGPGLSPKALVGKANYERIWCGGAGESAAERSYLYYNYFNDLYNWGNKLYQGGSAGYIGVARHDGGEINGIVRYFWDLYVSKGGANQSLHAVTGSNPDPDSGDLKVKAVFNNEGAACGDSLAEIGNNILMLDNDALLAVEGIQGGGFGDVRKYPASVDVANLITPEGAAGAFATYDRERDVYLLQLAGADYSLAYSALLRGWTYWRWAGLSPTMFNHQDGTTFIGSGGYLYALDDGVGGRDGWFDSTDTGQGFEAELWGPMRSFDTPGAAKELDWLVYQLSARMGASGQVMIRTDYGKVEAPALTRKVLVPLDDDVAVGELGSIIVEHWDYPVGSTSNRLQAQNLHFNAKLIQVGLRLRPGGAPVFLGPVSLNVVSLGRN